MTAALVTALLLLLLAAVVVFGVRRRRRRATIRRAARALPRRELPRAPRLPVVLAHGFLGFDAIGVGGVRQEYFRGIARGLAEIGARVHSFRVAPIASITTRAAELAHAIATVDAPQVHIVAHSMGGLDGRFAVAQLGLAPRVRSLVTIATPHRGTPLADLGSMLLGARFGLGPLWKALSMSGVLDLTTARMERFNGEVPDVAGIEYRSVLAAVADTAELNPLLLPTFLYLRECAGENDGLVPLASQRWGEVLSQVRADHWAQIGWSSGFRALDLYMEICRELLAIEERGARPALLQGLSTKV
jgi:triacylglycerol lipase